MRRGDWHSRYYAFSMYIEYKRFSSKALPLS